MCYVLVIKLLKLPMQGFILQMFVDLLSYTFKLKLTIHLFLNFRKIGSIVHRVVLRKFFMIQLLTFYGMPKEGNEMFFSSLQVS